MTLREVRVVNDTVGGVDVVIAASGESRSARAYVSARGKPSPRKTVTTRTLTPRSSWWTPAAPVGRSPRRPSSRKDDPSTTLPRIPTLTSFWFGWYQYHPDTEIYKPGG